MFLALRVCITALLLGVVLPLSAQEVNMYQGAWVYGWGNVGDGSGCLSAADTDSVFSKARENNMNCLFIQVRKIGDALYPSQIEPFFANADTSYTDPLADILAKAHDTSNGKQYMEVHAWIVPYRVWKDDQGTPPSNHVWNLHPEWRGQTNTGSTSDGSRYLDPGVPAVTDYLVDVATELVTKYPTLDGIHWDYFRYSGVGWGYNPTAIARFNTLYARTGTPATNDAEFCDFRRDQVRQMGRKVYAAVKAIRWNCKVSAATITWAPWYSDFTQNRPYYQVFQDWPSFMNEGLLDMNVPMTYMREHDTAQKQCFRDWSNFMAQSKAGRHVLCGPGVYMNTIAGSMTQINYSSAIPGMDGTNLYVLHATHSTSLDPQPDSAFWSALRTQTHYSKQRSIPAAPWISAPTQGILRGTVRDLSTSQVLDGTTVTLSGPTEGAIRTDGTGFYAFLKANPGATHTLSASMPGYVSPTTTCSVQAGQVTTQDIVVAKPGILRGTVTDAETMQVIEGATITVSGPTNASVTTDASGAYELTNLYPAVLYTVTIEKSGYRTESQSASIQSEQVTVLDFGATAPVGISRFHAE